MLGCHSWYYTLGVLFILSGFFFFFFMYLAGIIMFLILDELEVMIY